MRRKRLATKLGDDLFCGKPGQGFFSFLMDVQDHKTFANTNHSYWSSESGSPLTGVSLIPSTGHKFDAIDGSKQVAIRPGSAGKPMPGWNVRVVDDEGKEVEGGKMGNIVLGMPLAPTGLTTLWQDEERFYKGYMKRFDGKWIDTGDAGMIDLDGYVHVMSRSDDIINVAVSGSTPQYGDRENGS